MTQTAAVENTITSEFRIPEQNMGYLEEQIEQLNKRAKRLHCSQIVLDDPMAVAYSAQFIAEACQSAEDCIDDDFEFGRPSKKLSTEYFLA